MHSVSQPKAGAFDGRQSVESFALKTFPSHPTSHFYPASFVVYFFLPSFLSSIFWIFHFTRSRRQNNSSFLPFLLFLLRSFVHSSPFIRWSDQPFSSLYASIWKQPVHARYCFPVFSRLFAFISLSLFLSSPFRFFLVLLHCESQHVPPSHEHNDNGKVKGKEQRRSQTAGRTDGDSFHGFNGRQHWLMLRGKRNRHRCFRRSLAARELETFSCSQLFALFLRPLFSFPPLTTTRGYRCSSSTFCTSARKSVPCPQQRSTE